MQQGSRIKPVVARAEGWFAVFGINGVMPGQTGSDQKEKEQGRRRMRYVNSDLVHPCNPASFHVAQCGCYLTPVEMRAGILMLD